MNLKSLIAKLNDTTRGAMEGAAGICMTRTCSFGTLQRQVAVSRMATLA